MVTVKVHKNPELRVFKIKNLKAIKVKVLSEVMENTFDLIFNFLVYEIFGNYDFTKDNIYYYQYYPFCFIAF